MILKATDWFRYWPGLLCLLVAGVYASPQAQSLSWTPFQQHRLARLTNQAAHAPGFSRIIGSASGIRFTNTLSQARKIANANLMNGSGVALGDFDGDGKCDIYLCDLSGSNALYKNLGDWRFTNVTEQAGVSCPGQTSTGAVFADVNADGKLDLLVTSMGGPHACFINLGNGRFTNTIATAGFGSRLGATSMALADIDGNGTLDLYVANYGATSILRSGGALNVSYENGKPVVRGRYAQRIRIIDSTMWELGEPDMLYLNDGLGNFRPISWTDGTFRKADGSALQETDIPWDQGLSVIMRDLNGDGAPDIYVCNDAFTPDRFWINDGKGRFRELPHERWRVTSHFSMGVDVADFDRDGKDDIFVVDMLGLERKYFMTQKGNMPAQSIHPGELGQIQSRRNTLLRNRGGLDFEEIAHLAGVAASDWSWSGLFLDVDLDGWEDLLITNGFDQNADDMDTQEKVRSLGRLSVEQSRRAQLLYPALKTPNVAYRNRHGGSFEEVGRLWGFDSTDISQGMAFADLDNDGDLDVVINTYNAEALVYRNETSAPRIGVRLKGKAPNLQGIGAKIIVEGGPVQQTQEMICGGRYVSGDEAMRVFACGTVTNQMAVTVMWRSGRMTRVANIPANSVVEINEADSEGPRKGNVELAKPLFANQSEVIDHKHQEAYFDDFVVQPSLYRRVSQAGPGIVCADFNSDGWDDIAIGTGGTGEVALRINTGKNAFQGRTIPALRDETSGLVAWRNERDETEFVISINNLERQTGNSLELVTVDASGAVLRRSTLPGGATGGPLALTESGGQIYLFHGQRFIPNAYPVAAPSELYVRRAGEWQKDRSNDPVVRSLGLVNGAVWSDLNNDGSPELILACEWGPIRILEFRAGKLTDVTGKWGLQSFTGLWQSIATGDFDGDGRMDLVAGNWGLNSFYNRAPNHEVDLYYGDIDSANRVDMIEAYFDPNLKKIVPWRDKRTLSAFWPWINERFPTHAQFALASIAEVLEDRFSRMTHLHASTLDSCVFLNRGDHFERLELPTEAQVAPVFGINVADFNGDGMEDIFVAQNFFAVRDSDSPMEAGRGLLLSGSATNFFAPLSSAESGIQIFGEQRGSASGDFNRDGRVDLVVSQNGGVTSYLKNVGALPGLRVSLRGPDQNRLAAGAGWRIGNEKGWGARHEIQIGSGYWSQDSTTKVVKRPSGRAKLEVYWPNGKKGEYEVPPGSNEIEISQDNGVKSIALPQ